MSKGISKKQGKTYVVMAHQSLKNQVNDILDDRLENLLGVLEKYKPASPRDKQFYIDLSHENFLKEMERLTRILASKLQFKVALDSIKKQTHE